MTRRRDVMTAKPPIEFTEERKQRYIDYVREHGVYYLAAAHAGVTPETAIIHRKTDKEFGARVDEAKEQHTDMLVEAATARAVKGVRKPIVGGQFKDEIVAYEQVYSDGLMQTLLKSKRAEYGAQGVEAIGGGVGNGGGGGILIVPYAPHSIVEWVELYGEAAKGMTGSESQ